MSKTLAIFGATGTQGSSVVNHVLTHPALSSTYALRAITRDTSSPKAKALTTQGIFVVQGDMSDPSSLPTALAGVHTVFIITTPSFHPTDALEIEFQAGKAIADAAVAQGVEYIIFSTLPSISDLSGGKYTSVVPFDAKAKIEAYIRGLPVKSAFVSGAFFMENFTTQPFLGPVKQAAAEGEEDTWALVRPISGGTKLPYIDASGDLGKYVGAILEEPERYEGRILHAAEKLYTLEEISGVIGRTSGKKVVYKRVSVEEFGATLPPFLLGLFADAFAGLEEVGYWGPETERLVSEGKESVKEKLTTLEEYLAKHPVPLL